MGDQSKLKNTHNGNVSFYFRHQSADNDVVLREMRTDTIWYISQHVWEKAYELLPAELLEMTSSQADNKSFFIRKLAAFECSRVDQRL